eukprot:15435579-Alexandrium_andersonii.AAC.1
MRKRVAAANAIVALHCHNPALLSTFARVSHVSLRSNLVFEAAPPTGLPGGMLPAFAQHVATPTPRPEHLCDGPLVPGRQYLRDLFHRFMDRSTDEELRASKAGSGRKAGSSSRPCAVAQTRPCWFWRRSELRALRGSASAERATAKAQQQIRYAAID